MTGTVREMAGVRVLLAERGVSAAGDAADLVGAALSDGATLVAIPAERFAPEFLELSSGLAGEVLQKFVNYRLRVAVVGDVSERAAKSKALTDFVRESNRGRHVWFVEDLGELERRLAQ